MLRLSPLTTMMLFQSESTSLGPDPYFESVLRKCVNIAAVDVFQNVRRVRVVDQKKFGSLSVWFIFFSAEKEP